MLPVKPTLDHGILTPSDRPPEAASNHIYTGTVISSSIDWLLGVSTAPQKVPIDSAFDTSIAHIERNTDILPHMAAPSLAERIATAYKVYPQDHYERVSAITPLAKALAAGQIRDEGPEFRHISTLLSDHPDFSPDITKATFRFHRVIRREETELKATLLASTGRVAGKSRKSKARVQHASDQARSAIVKSLGYDGRQQAFSAQLKEFCGGGVMLSRETRADQSEKHAEQRETPYAEESIRELWTKKVQNREDMRLAGVPTAPRAMRDGRATAERNLNKRKAARSLRNRAWSR